MNVEMAVVEISLTVWNYIVIEFAVSLHSQGSPQLIPAALGRFGINCHRFVTLGWLLSRENGDQYSRILQDQADFGFRALNKPLCRCWLHLFSVTDENMSLCGGWDIGGRPSVLAGQWKLLAFRSML
jgi:hypothetical protein